MDSDIACKCTTFTVQRIIIGMHSQDFKRICDGAFRESGQREVVLKCDSLAAVTAMVDHCYSYDYKPPTLTSLISRKAKTEGQLAILRRTHTYTPQATRTGYEGSGH